MANKLLIVEDNEGIQKFLRDLLVENNFIVEVAKDATTALKLLKTSLPDLLIMDLGVSASVEKVYLDIKKKYPDLSSIILTTKDNIAKAKNKLNLGESEYITKPFIAEDLLALVKDKFKNFNDVKLYVADLEINSKTFEVKRAGKLIKLSLHEFKLLHYLLSNKGRVLSREMILNKVWLYSMDVDTRVVDVYIGYLRKKIDGGFNKKLIHSIRGFGYVIKE